VVKAAIAFGMDGKSSFHRLALLTVALIANLWFDFHHRTVLIIDPVVMAALAIIIIGRWLFQSSSD
jgi:hypothetical protein